MTAVPGGSTGAPYHFLSGLRTTQEQTRMSCSLAHPVWGEPWLEGNRRLWRQRPTLKVWVKCVCGGGKSRTQNHITYLALLNKWPPENNQKKSSDLCSVSHQSHPCWALDGSGVHAESGAAASDSEKQDSHVLLRGLTGSPISNWMPLSYWINSRVP